MPNRIIREAILSSEAIASLTWAEEVFYRRLMSIVDDYGRFEANPQLIRAKCYPLQTDDVKASEVSAWLESCRRAGVLQLYTANGKSYLEVSKFQQQTRTASKCPAPDSECSQMISNAHLDVVVSVVEVVSEAVVEKATVRKTAQYSEAFELSWAEYPKRGGGNSKAEAGKAWDARVRAGEDIHDMDAGVRRYAQFIRATGKEGTEYVKQASSFFGPNKHYLELWDPPRQATPPPAAPSKTMQALQNLQDMKNGLDHSGNSNGVSGSGVIEFGSATGLGRIANDG